jgi:hypothetical protein
MGDVAPIQPRNALPAAGNSAKNDEHVAHILQRKPFAFTTIRECMHGRPNRLKNRDIASHSRNSHRIYLFHKRPV